MMRGVMGLDRGGLSGWSAGGGNRRGERAAAAISAGHIADQRSVEHGGACLPEALVRRSQGVAGAGGICAHGR